MASDITPAPWERYGYIGRSKLTKVRACIGKDRVGREQYVDVPATEADARLIAAAPELLAACREMIEAMNDYEWSVDDPPTEEHRQMMLRALKAVEKATYHGEVKDD
jgi:hypothetical protein